MKNFLGIIPLVLLIGTGLNAMFDPRDMKNEAADRTRETAEQQKKQMEEAQRRAEEAQDALDDQALMPDIDE